MKRTLLIAAAATMLVAGCKNQNNMENPFFSAWNTPYEIPDFSRIKTEHYMPAFQEGMARQKAEIDAITGNSEAPTFENTILAYEYSGQLLKDVSGVFFNLSECENSPEMDSIAEAVTPLLSAHDDDIALNQKLFARIKAVYDQRETLGLNPEQLRLLTETYKGFVRAGANVPEAQQPRFRELNEQIASLTLRFAQNVLKATNDYKKVLPSGDTVTLDVPTWEPFMQSCPDRALREEVWHAYADRCQGGKFDNTKIIDTLVNLRLERANILGFPTHADYVLDDCLAKTPANVYRCLMDIWTPALNTAKQERDLYQKMLSQDEPGAKLQPWDWRYYSEKYRAEKYAIDDAEVRPYFALDSVREGAFMVANRLYGLTFTERTDLPTYDKEARCFEVRQGDSTVGILYMDFHPRASKRSGAWMTEFRGLKIENGVEERPFISLVTNFTKPTADTPSLITHDEFTTMLHEFGHSLHGMLAKGRYPSMTCTNVDHDFVELPSQIMENWGYEKEYLQSFAKHYQTGDALPDSLIAKIKASKNYLSAYYHMRQLQFGILDMNYHTQTKPIQGDIIKFEKNALISTDVLPTVPECIISTSFSHIFSGGYAAGYYSYKWAEVLAADGFSLFEEKGIFDKQTAAKFRHLLEQGGSVEAAKLYREFRGHDPEPAALLRQLEIIENDN